MHATSRGNVTSHKMSCHVSWNVMSRGNATSRLMEIIISTEELRIEHAKYHVLPRVSTVEK